MSYPCAIIRPEALAGGGDLPDTNFPAFTAEQTLIQVLHGIYIACLLFMSAVLMGKSRGAADAHLKNIFWALTVFAIMKAGASLAAYGWVADGAPKPLSGVVKNSRIIFAVLSNIFLFHFGISILTYRVETRIDYKIFPVLLFVGYMTLYVSGSVETADLVKTSRFSFAYNGAILGFVGCINLYLHKKRTGGRRRVLYGLLMLGTGLLAYAVTEGILSSSSSPGTGIKILEVVTAVILAAASVLVTGLLKKETSRKIGFI
ncbi:MAG: hypothetical protein GXO94_02745 [Nitrospirae bacterium]|nr:hypothetical protein [Nitrospirota bacterium]